MGEDKAKRTAFSGQLSAVSDQRAALFVGKLFCSRFGGVGGVKAAINFLDCRELFNFDLAIILVML